jgi:flavin-binding protein dodecin
MIACGADEPCRGGYPRKIAKEVPMSNAVAKVIELTAASPKSIEDAVENGIRRADETLDHVEGVWIQDIKCVVKNGKVSEWRVNMKVSFLLKE